MVQEQQLESALYSLHLILVELRSIAYCGCDSAIMADILDWAEAMPFLIAKRDEDRTLNFRQHLAGIVERDPRFQRVLDAFDANRGFFG